jgi:hypothetical protein
MATDKSNSASLGSEAKLWQAAEYPGNLPIWWLLLDKHQRSLFGQL